MLIYYLIAIVSTLVWVLVPIRQYRTKYFQMFLLFGIKDLLGFVLHFTSYISAYKTSLPIELLIILSLFNKLNRDNMKYIIPIFSVIFIMNYIFITGASNNILHVFISFIFLSFFMSKFFKRMYLLNTFSLYYAVLVAYFALSLLKYVNILTINLTSVTLFFIETGIQILIGLYFLKFTNRDNNFRLSSSKKEHNLSNS